MVEEVFAVVRIDVFVTLVGVEICARQVERKIRIEQH